MFAFGGLVGKKVATKDKRWYKDVGLGYKTPAEAINGTYVGASIHIVSIYLLVLIQVCTYRQEMPIHW